MAGSSWPIVLVPFLLIVLSTVISICSSSPSTIRRRSPIDIYPTVYVLLEGYYQSARPGDAPDTLRMSSTVTLIVVGNKTIVVDTGTSNHGSYLQTIMPQRFGIKLGSIDLLVITHMHPDHYESALGFYPADQLIHKQYVKMNEFINTPLKTSDSMSPLDINELTVLSTPGHTSTDISLIVRNFNNTGKSLAIVGDLFLDAGDEERTQNGTSDPRWMRRSDYPHTQKKYRRMIACQVDYIIPGHGAMFEVSQEAKNTTLACYSGQARSRGHRVLSVVLVLALIFRW